MGKRAAAALEAKIDSEFEFEVIAWVRARKLGLSWTSDTKLLTSTSGVIKIPDSLFPGLKCIRLRKLAFGVYVKDDQTQRPATFMLSVRPPDTEASFPIAAPVVNSRSRRGGPPV